MCNFSVKVTGAEHLKYIAVNPIQLQCPFCHAIQVSNNLNDPSHLRRHLITKHRKSETAVNLACSIDSFSQGLHGKYENQTLYSALRLPESLLLRCPREEGKHYLSVWLDGFLKSSIIKPTSLTYEELDSLFMKLLTTSKQVMSYNQFKTLTMYCETLWHEGGTKALQLYLGQFGQNLGRETTRITMTEINHAGPSLRSLQRNTTPVQFKNATHMDSVLAMGLLLTNAACETSSDIVNNGRRQMPITLMFDQQPLNKGKTELMAADLWQGLGKY